MALALTARVASRFFRPHVEEPVPIRDVQCAACNTINRRQLSRHDSKCWNCGTDLLNPKAPRSS